MNSRNLLLAFLLALLVTPTQGWADDPDAQAVPAPTQVQQAPITAAAAQTQPTQVQGAVMMNVAVPSALVAKDVLQVSTAPVTGKGKYQGVKYSLKNTQGNHIQLLQAEVVNGIDEAVVAQEELQKSNTRRRVAGGLLRGLSAVPFVGGFGYASVGAYQAAAIGSHVAVAAANTLDAASTQTMASIEGRFVRNLPTIVINPNEVFSFQTLVPPGVTPQIKLVFKNLETNQIFDLVQ